MQTTRLLSPDYSQTLCQFWSQSFRERKSGKEDTEAHACDPQHPSYSFSYSFYHIQAQVQVRVAISSLVILGP